MFFFCIFSYNKAREVDREKLFPSHERQGGVQGVRASLLEPQHENSVRREHVGHPVGGQELRVPRGAIR